MQQLRSLRVRRRTIPGTDNREERCRSTEGGMLVDGFGGLRGCSDKQKELSGEGRTCGKKEEDVTREEVNRSKVEVSK